MTAQKITLTPAQLLPHKPPMLLLTSCGIIDGERVTAQCIVGEQCRLFTLPDGNYGACAGITEMLLQTAPDGTLKVLPALPSSWTQGRVRGLRTRSGRRVDIEWKDGQSFVREYE